MEVRINNVLPPVANNIADFISPGWINDLLSWEAFQPLSKVSYIMYLTHLTIYQIVIQSFTYSFTYTHYIAVLYFLSCLVITVLVSAVIFVGVELPWLNLEKLMVTRIAQSLTKGTNKKSEAPMSESKAAEVVPTQG